MKIIETLFAAKGINPLMRKPQWHKVMCTTQNFNSEFNSRAIFLISPEESVRACRIRAGDKDISRKETFFGLCQNYIKKRCGYVGMQTGRGEAHLWIGEKESWMGLKDCPSGGGRGPGWMPGREEMPGSWWNQGMVMKGAWGVIAIFIMTLKCQTILGNYQRPFRLSQKVKMKIVLFVLFVWVKTDGPTGDIIII